MCRTVLQKTWRSSRLEVTVFKCFSTQKRCYVACILQMEGTFGKPRHNKHFVGRVTDVLDTSGERSARVSLQAAAVELSSRYWQQTSYLHTHVHLGILVQLQPLRGGKFVTVEVVCLRCRLLNNNQLTRLENGTFEGLTNLHYLWVIHHRIRCTWTCTVCRQPMDQTAPPSNDSARN